MRPNYRNKKPQHTELSVWFAEHPHIKRIQQNLQ